MSSSHLNPNTFFPRRNIDVPVVIDVGPGSAHAADVAAWNDLVRSRQQVLERPDPSVLVAEQEALDRAAWKREVGGSDYLDTGVYGDIANCLSVYSQAYELLTGKQLHIDNYTELGYAFVSEKSEIPEQEETPIFYLSAGSRNRQDALKADHILQESYHKSRESIISRMQGDAHKEAIAVEATRQIHELNDRKRSRVLDDIDVLDRMRELMEHNLRRQYDLPWHDNGAYDMQFKRFCDGVDSFRDKSTWVDRPIVPDDEAIDDVR